MFEFYQWEARNLVSLDLLKLIYFPSAELVFLGWFVWKYCVLCVVNFFWYFIGEVALMLFFDISCEFIFGNLIIVYDRRLIISDYNSLFFTYSSTLVCLIIINSYQSEVSNTWNCVGWVFSIFLKVMKITNA